MPELPEVETIVQDLNKSLNNKKISSAKVFFPRIASPGLANKLKNKRVSKIQRRGKLIIIQLLDHDQALLVHLKMTGQLFFQQQQKIVAGGHGEEVPPDLVQGRPSKHTHVVINFPKKERLYYNDIRKFGYLKLIKQEDLPPVLARYGPEPNSKEFTIDYLRQKLATRKTALKNVLLNQQVIAGLGNIYVDEACFAAGIRPMRQANKVTILENKKLFHAINKIIAAAIKARGTTFSDYRDGAGKPGGFAKKLKVYNRVGQACRRAKCSGIIKKVKVNGRGTHYCPKCQK